MNDYDIIICGETTGTDSQKDKATLNPWMERGVTWWLEDINGIRAEVDVLRERIRAGPPEV